VLSERPRAFGARLCIAAFISLTATFLAPRTALAEKVLAKGDDWEVFTDGRVGGFLSYVHVDDLPVPDPNKLINGKPESLTTGGWTITPVTRSGDGADKIDMWRVRSGFLGNQLGVGVRGYVTPWTTATGYIQMWAWVESDARDKKQINQADVRQGYAKLEGTWGSFLAGRTRTLYSRGATDINVMYAHKWGVGFPNVVDGRGPTQGMVGFGVMGSGFGAGIIYGTPNFHGLQLNVGLFDPVALGGPGWNGTKAPRGESELTYELKFGTTGKLVFFGDGAYQKLYKPGLCAAPDICKETVQAVGYGGRFELGPFHLGVAGYLGKGLGLSYALENSYAAIDTPGHLRKSDGYYVQTQVVVNKFDFFAGWGIARIFLTDFDKSAPEQSVIKYQMGINGGVVYNLTPNVHFDFEYFRAYAKWYLGEHQTLHCPSAGMIFNW